MAESAELVFIPVTLRGHLAVTVDFAKLVVSRDDRLSATVIIPKRLPDPSLAAHVDFLVASFARSQRIKFVVLDNEFEIDEDTTNIVVAASLVADSLKIPIKNHVEEMVHGSGTRLAGFVMDMMLMSVADVADELGAPTYFLWTCSAGFFSLNLHVFQLNRTENALEKCRDSESWDVPGFSKPVPTRTFATLFLGIDSYSEIMEKADLRLRNSKGVLMNTSLEIEPHAIRSLMSFGDRYPPVYPVGPVLNLFSTDSVSDGKDILTWLDRQPPASVIFLCFGSMGSVSPDQVKEIASALETAGLRFLWALRVKPPPTTGQPRWTSAACEDHAAILPEGFLERTAEAGRVIEWAPQADVLAHPAVGGFVSHCGWNSILESMWFGVPVAAWPLYAEQHVNEFEMVAELGLSTAVKPGCKADVVGEEVAVVGAKDIEAAMRRVMDSESEVRRRVKETSEKVRKAVKEGGSSLSSLDDFVRDVFQSLY